MKILHEYILRLLIRNLLLCLLLFTILFLVIDFFDRIDNIMTAGGTFYSTVQYFLYKIPLTVNFMLPLAMLVSTLFTFGLLSKNSELVAMRAAGLSIGWLARPLFAAGISVSLISILLKETIVPVATRRVREIYDLDIQQKDSSGSYSHSNFWWRKDNRFLSIGTFDSRNNTMYGLSIFDIKDSFEVAKRLDAKEGHWLDTILGWSMKSVREYRFNKKEDAPEISQNHTLPLPITEEPEEFYDAKTDPDTMNYRSLRRYMKQQAANGIPVTRFLTDIQEKLSFPFINFIICLVALPFSLKPSRSGSMAVSFIAGLLIGFSYYIVHSVSIAMGRAEFMPPILAAWMANIVMGFIGLVLHLGSEAPQ